MPSPSALIPVMEGMVSTQATGARGRMEPALWVEMMKLLLRATGARDETDFEFALADDVDQTANVISAAATFILGVLVEQDASDAERDWVVATDADSNTFDGTAALDNDDVILIQPRATGTDGTPEYVGVAIVGGPDTLGFPLDTGLSLGADGRDGADPAADDIRAWILYRD